MKKLSRSFALILTATASTALSGFAQTTISTAQSTTTGISLSNGQTLTVTSSGTYTDTGSTVAVTFATGTTTLTNSGTIQQTSTGKALRGTGTGINVTVTNNLGATILSTQDDAFQMNKDGTVTLKNYGTINSENTGNTSGAQGVDWNAITTGSNTLYNYSTGLIEAGDNDAVRPGVNGFVYNSGTLTATSGSGDGINTQKNSGVTIINDDTTHVDAGTAPMIIGTHHGIGGGDSSGATSYTISVTNNANGTIKGLDGSGINLDSASQDGGITIPQTAVINNQGLIQGDGVTGDGDGIDVDGTVTITNGSVTNSKAKIVSLSAFNDTSEGVTVGGGTINNYGTIQGSIVPVQNVANTGVGRGITLAGTDKNGSGNPIQIQGVYTTTSVTNFLTGQIIGDSDAGIAIEGDPATAATAYGVTLTNAGLIKGNATGAGNNVAAIEADISTGVAQNNLAIVDTGTITDAFSGKAIDFGNGKTNSLTITGGSASIVGDINGGTGSTTISIDPGAGNAFSYAGAISNVAGLENKSGTVTFTGASTYAGPTKISGGTTYVNNTAGSGTGSSNVEVMTGASFGGKGIVQPGVGNAVKLDNGGTLISGVIPATGTVAGGGLTLDNMVAKGIVLDASGGNATLTFMLGSGPSGSFDFSTPDTNSSFMTVIGNFTGELKFASGDFINLDDLTGGKLQLVMSSPYLLISTTAGNNSDFAGLTTTGGATNGIANNGYVTNLSLEGLNPAIYPNARLFLDNGNLEVVPEPSTWAMMVGGLLTLIVLRFRRRLKR